MSPVRGPFGFSEDGTLFVDEGSTPPQSPVFYGLVICPFGGEDRGLYGQGFFFFFTPPLAVLTFILVWPYFSGTFYS